MGEIPTDGWGPPGVGLEEEKMWFSKDILFPKVIRLGLALAFTVLEKSPSSRGEGLLAALTIWSKGDTS